MAKMHLLSFLGEKNNGKFFHEPVKALLIPMSLLTIRFGSQEVPKEFVCELLCVCVNGYKGNRN